MPYFLVTGEVTYKVVKILKVDKQVQAAEIARLELVHESPSLEVKRVELHVKELKEGKE